jgi:hypothetical protein
MTAVSLSAGFLIVIAMVWLAFEIYAGWRCPKCGRINRSPDFTPSAFCSRCGAPRPRGDRRVPVPIVFEAGRHVPSHVVDTIAEIFASERVAESLPAGTRATAKVVAAVPAGASIAFAHPTWKPEFVDSAVRLPPFPHRPPLEILPADIVRVEISAVERTTGGMSSHFLFEGIYVSVLVSLSERKIWDVRATNAY